MARRFMSATRSSITNTSDSLKTKGAIFVEELAEIPDNTSAPVVFSAHGVPNRFQRTPGPAISLDATCPLVTKVHREAAIHFKRGREILLIGHSTTPRCRHARPVAHGGRDADRDRRGRQDLHPEGPEQSRFVTQTTLSIDDTAEIVAMLKERFPNISGPHRKTSATPPPTANSR
jgi:4-hydroxy-3-methylbut-2-enyl diphosphate reductase